MLKATCFFTIALLISFGNINAQEIGPGQPVPLFQSEEMLTLEMKADFKEVFSNHDDSTNYPAQLTLTDNAGQVRTVEIRIRTRGITRREPDVCRFTPLRVNFPKKGTENTPFEGQNVIKLVTHCDKPDSYVQNTIMEYLIYKAFNVMTDSSFKVRPAMITYIFTGKKADTVQKFAFFIEREKHLAERLHGIEIESQKYHPNRLNPLHSCMMDMFQYMIGNTDYSITELHNIMLLADSVRLNPPIAIPYDFDWSGLISARYAVPHPLMNTESVTQRVYRGFKKDPEIVNQTINVFKARKEEIYSVFQDYNLLNADDKEEAIKYLDGFYKIINDERMVKTEFFDKAREEH